MLKLVYFFILSNYTIVYCIKYLFNYDPLNLLSPKLFKFILPFFKNPIIYSLFNLTVFCEIIFKLPKSIKS